MNKLISSFVVAFLLLSIFSPSAFGANFKDVKNYNEEIDFLVNREVIKGYEDNTFRPKRGLTRLQAVTMILRDKKITNFTAANPNFSDMAIDSKGYREVAKAVEMGIISGKTAKDGSKFFDPNGTLTRAQMAKILVTAYQLPINKSKSFKDVLTTDGAKDYISTLAFMQITTGYTDGTFGPNKVVSREHFAVFMSRLLNEKFRPKETIQTSFLRDITKDYYYESKNFNYNFKYLGTENKMNKWNYDVPDFTRLNSIVHEYEDSEGLKNSAGNIKLKYPIRLGEEWNTGNTIAKIVSINNNVTTRAGSFKGVVEVKYVFIDEKDRAQLAYYTYFFAPGVGLIKDTMEGITDYELVRLE